MELRGSCTKILMSYIMYLWWSIVHTNPRTVGIRRSKLSSHHRVVLTVLGWSRATSTCTFEPRWLLFESYVLILDSHHCITLHLLRFESVLSAVLMG